MVGILQSSCTVLAADNRISVARPMALFTPSDSPRQPPADAPQTPRRPRADARPPGVSWRGRRKAKTRLLARSDIDNRCTRTLARFDAIVHGLAQDLGGEQHLTTVQKYLVQGFAGVALSLSDLNARLLLGEEVDLLAQSQAI